MNGHGRMQAKLARLQMGFVWPQGKTFGSPKSMAVFVLSITLAVRTMSHLFLSAMDTRQCSNAFVPNLYGRYRP